MAVEQRNRSIASAMAVASAAAICCSSTGVSKSSQHAFLAPATAAQPVSFGPTSSASAHGTSPDIGQGVSAVATAGAAAAAVTFALASGSRSRARPAAATSAGGRRVAAVAGSAAASGSKTARQSLPWPFNQSEDKKKTVVITGASSGLGLQAAKHLAKSGDYYVIMACRDFSKGQSKARELGLPEDSYKVMHMDLACQESVRDFVRSFRTFGLPLDALVCNAAVYFPNAHKDGVVLPGLFPGGGARFAPDGTELSFATNYLGHFLLCKLMLEDLKAAESAKCIILGTVTATVNKRELGGQILPLADIGQLEGLEQGMKQPVTMVDGGAFDGAKAYKDSKVCDVMLMRELHNRFHKETGIMFSSLYPGCIAETNLFRNHYPVFQKLFPAFHKNVTKAYISQDEAGARLATVVSDERYNTSGAYYSWAGSAGTGGGGGTVEAVDNLEKTTPDWFANVGSFKTLMCEDIGGDAGDDVRCRKLWELSEKLVEEPTKTVSDERRPEETKELLMDVEA